MSTDLIDRILAAGPTIGEHSGAELGRVLGRVTDQLVAAGVRPGEAVGFRGANRPEWLVALLALLRVGARPLLIAHDSPEPDVLRTLRTARGGRCLVVDDLDALTWLEAPAGAVPGASGEAPAVLLASSGSTGAPKIVPRSPASLLDEGLRYVNAGLVSRADRVVVPLPMSHSYALGWVVGALLAGARVQPLPPQALGATQRALADGATVLTVVPGLARLLLRRLGPAAKTPDLRLVMAGAGYVDAELDARWAAATGVGLSRNYGSTETGAVLSGPAGLPSGFVGAPMPGVDLRLRSDDGAGSAEPSVGEVVVTLEDGSTHAMGDLARRDESGWVQIIGRRTTSAVRRGARWVSTLELRSVLATAYGVADVAVTGSATDDDDQTLTAEFVPAGATVTAASLAEYARAHLAPYKVPNVFVPRRRIVRNPLGKTPKPPAYRLTSAAVVAEAVSAYRRSELVLALAELGVLERLADGRTAPELADDLGLDVDAVTELIAVAHHLGLVTTGEPGEPVDPAAITGLVDAERELRTGLTAAALTSATRGEDPVAAPGRRPRDAAHIAEVRRLAAAGPHDVAAQFGPGPADYAAPGDPAAPPESYDVCYVVDAVHGPGADLVWLAERLRVGGRLVVEDRFIDGPGQFDLSVSLAWLAGGSHAWWYLSDFQAGLESVGLAVEAVESVPDPPRMVVVARRGTP
ncbi:class I adenylate-forming enzyme family protein [Plantactinospora sp. CA-290183]|uniref:class I adenylate-forming enzyme family protein n=1 Tax=Plantactinospora sp. CA-290183 TaxID=3240006 RepID=UPI003D8FE860